MQALLPQLGSEGSLSEITDRLRSHSLHSDSPPRAPLVIAGAAAPVSGGLGAEVRSPPGQEERSRGIPPARGGMFGDGGEASTSSVGGRSRKAVPWEIPVPRSRGVESPVLSPTSPLSVGSSASDTAPPPLDTGQNRPPLLKTTVLGDLVESHDNQAPRRSVGHGPPGQVIKRRPSRGGVQERVQDPPDPATLLVAGRSAHAGGSSPELLGPPSRTSEIMRPLSLLKVDSGKGGAFMPLSPGGISGVGLQAPEGVSGGWGRESSFMERIQMSAARSNSERDAGVPTGRISSDVSRSGEGSEAGREHEARVYWSSQERND